MTANLRKILQTKNRGAAGWLIRSQARDGGDGDSHHGRRTCARASALLQLPRANSTSDELNRAWTTATNCLPLSQSASSSSFFFNHQSINQNNFPQLTIQIGLVE